MFLVFFLLLSTYHLGLSLLRLLELRVDALGCLALSLFQHLRVEGLAELGEDLRTLAIRLLATEMV